MSSWTPAALRLLHFAGLAGSAGSLIGLAAIGAADHPAAAAALIGDSMLPALGLALASGAALAWQRRLDPRRQPWFVIHAGLALAMLALGLGFLRPTANLLAALAEMHGGDMAMPAYAGLAGRLRLGIAAELALALGLVAVAVARRPRLRQNVAVKG